MKEWLVIHKIKSLYDNGKDLTERKIAQKDGYFPQHRQQIFRDV